MKKCNFTWEISSAGWKWEATEYQGKGIFFGKVSSPFVPDGELGTWYYWEIKKNGAMLTKGSQADVDKLVGSKATQKTMAWQEAVLDVNKETGVWN